jgi:ribonuclease D
MPLPAPPCLLPLAEASDSTPPEDSGLHFKLTDLHAKVLGRALDKSEQFGNWAMRPLRPEQKCYAATDAHCLVAIYEKLENIAK